MRGIQAHHLYFILILLYLFPCLIHFLSCCLSRADSLTPAKTVKHLAPLASCPSQDKLGFPNVGLLPRALDLQRSTRGVLGCSVVAHPCAIMPTLNQARLQVPSSQDCDTPLSQTQCSQCTHALAHLVLWLALTPKLRLLGRRRTQVLKEGNLCCSLHYK